MNLGRDVSTWLVGVLVSTTFLQTSAPGSTIRDDQSAGAYLDLANAPEYDPVGLFVNSWGYTGCATLISSDWVLTAAHVLTGASSGTFTLNGNVYTSAEFIKHPGWNGDAWNGYDIALVRLNTPVFGVPPASLYSGSSEVGMTATFVGYGFTGTGLTGWQTFGNNQKRAFQNVIDGDFGNPSVLLGSDFDNPHNPADNDFGAADPLTLEGCVAPGDSGGGVFVSAGSQSYLAGVISFVAGRDGNGNADYGDVSAFGRVSTLVPWILAAVPEPSAFILLAGGLGAQLVFFLRRRRR